jgi:nicotinamide mononucleotide transporter
MLESLFEFVQRVGEQLLATPPWEAAAIVLAVVYLLLAVKRSLWCWLFAFLSTAIFLVIMWQARLYMHVPLHVFYLVMAVYGYVEWRRGSTQAGEVPIVRWSLQTHAIAIGAVVALSLVNGWWLHTFTADAAMPYVDAFVAWGSVLTTFMVARRVLENWLYWIVLDSVAALLYFSQGLDATGVLFLVYVGIVVHGYRVWLRESRGSVVST